jgi:hypothetical protein
MGEDGSEGVTVRARLAARVTGSKRGVKIMHRIWQMVDFAIVLIPGVDVG